MNTEEFIKAYNKKLTDKELGKLFNISENQVLRLRKKLNLKAHSRKFQLIDHDSFMKYYNQNLQDKEIAKLLGVSKSYIHLYRNELHLPKVDPLKKEKDLILQGEKILSRSTRYKIRKQANLIKPFEAKDLILTDEEFQVILGSLLGDGNISVKHPKKGGGVLRIKHCLKQKDYCLYKQQLLKRLNPKYKEIQCHDNRFKIKDYIEVLFYTESLKCLKNFYDRWYIPKKSICLDDFCKINSLGLAIWYMDDGSKDKRRSKGCVLCTNSFTKKDLIEVCKILQNKFQLEISIRKNNTLYIKSKSFDHFVSLIKPYIIPSMLYKIQ